MAREAKDKEYARLAAIDVHSYNAAWRLKLPEAPKLLGWSDKDMKEWFSAKKKESFIYKSEACVAYPDGMTFEQVRDFKTKKVGLGINFCQGAASIYEQNPEGYKNKKEVQEVLDMFYETFPKIKIFQNEISQLAHKQGYLITRWGYIRRFNDVLKWDPNKWNMFTGSMGDWGHGDDFEACVAFPVANDAFGMLKEEMLWAGGFKLTVSSHVEFADKNKYIEGQGNIPFRQTPMELSQLDLYLQLKKLWPSKDSEDLLEKYGFCNQIHDSLFFHCDISLRDKCIEDILGIMREPCMTLSDPEMCPNGLFVDADVKVGPDWTNMKGVSA